VHFYDIFSGVSGGAANSLKWACILGSFLDDYWKMAVFIAYPLK